MQRPGDSQARRRDAFVPSLRFKLLAFAFLLVVVPGVVFALMSIASARRALELAVGRQLAEVAHDTAGEFTDALVREQNNVAMWARQDLMREVLIGDLDKRISRLLASLTSNGSAYLDLLCTDARGRVVAASSPALLGRDYADRPWLQAALAGKSSLAGPGPAPEGERAALEIASPVFDPERRDKVIGTLVGHYDWARLAALTERIQRGAAVLRLAVDVALLGDDGRVLAEAPPRHGVSLIGRNLREAGWRAAQRPLPVKHAGFVRESRAGTLVGFASVRGPRPGWTALVMQPLREAFAPVDRLQRRLILLLSGVLLSALGVALLLAERLSRPVRELTEATKEIARSGETRRPVEVRSRDEIGQLALAFNAMASRLKRAQDDLVAAAKFAFVGEVAAGVAHEVRTPLGILRSSAQILGRSLPADRPESAELVEMIIGEVDRLDRVIEGLLELARPRALQIEAASLAPVLHRALDFVEAPARERGVVLRGEIDPGQRRASCDPEQLYQVALNLIVNGLQILPRGGELTVRTVDNGRVGFEVEDNGPGMPPEVLERIFTPFFTMRAGGTGLGLALVQRVVQAHQGTVSVHSTVGRGTTFRVELPAAGE